MNIFDDNMAVGKDGYNRSRECAGWASGSVGTPWGFVLVYAQGDEQHSHHSRLDFIYNGRLYVRNFSGKRYTVRGLKSKAMQFAREIANRDN